MSDPIERELKNLLDERAQGDPRAAESLSDSIGDFPDRRRPIFGTGLSLAAALVVVAVLAAVVGPRLASVGGDPIARTPEPTVVPSVPSASMPAPTPMPPTATSTAGPAPAWVTDLAGQLACDGPVASIGGEAPDAFGVGVPGDTADAGLQSFLGPNNPFASLPAGGFSPIRADAHWASYAHLYEGEAKAIIVLTDTNEFGQEPGWLVIGLRACDASEFDPSVPLTFQVTIWTDSSGNRVPTDTIRSAPGPGHCDWDSAIFLKVDGTLYFRDPTGAMAQFTETRFEADSALPTGAVDSGFRSGDDVLWLAPGGDAYVVTSGGIERWPRSTRPDVQCR